jgi:hypothetical protein
MIASIFFIDPLSPLLLAPARGDFSTLRRPRRTLSSIRRASSGLRRFLAKNEAIASEEEGKITGIAQ